MLFPKNNFIWKLSDKLTNYITMISVSTMQNSVKMTMTMPASCGKSWECRMVIVLEMCASASTLSISWWFCIHRARAIDLNGYDVIELWVLIPARRRHGDAHSKLLRVISYFFPDFTEATVTPLFQQAIVNKIESGKKKSGCAYISWIKALCFSSCLSGAPPSKGHNPTEKGHNGHSGECSNWITN